MTKVGSPQRGTLFARITTTLILSLLPATGTVVGQHDPFDYLPLYDAYCEGAATLDEEHGECAFGYCDPGATVELSVTGSDEAPYYTGALYCGDTRVLMCSSDARDPDGCTAESRYTLHGAAVNGNLVEALTAEGRCEIDILSDALPDLNQLLLGGDPAPPESAYVVCTVHNYLI